MIPGARQFFEKRGAVPVPLPYDAEVEHLESTGTQYIDTQFFVADHHRIESRFAFTEATSNFGGLPFYYMKARGQNYGAFANITSNQIVIAARLSSTIAFDTLWHHLVLDTSNHPTASVDGSLVVTGSGLYGTVSSHPILLFCRQEGSAAIFYSNGRIAAFSIRDTSTNELLIDLIPVRKNGVGYMYDRVSGTLFGNAGTGAFRIGPDVSANSNGGGHKCVGYWQSWRHSSSRLSAWKEAA